jgi:hypothetical protein
MSAINEDAPTTELDNTPTDQDGAADAFLKKLMPPDAEKPSGSEEDDTTDDSADTETEKTEETSAEKPEDEDETKETAADKAARKYADDSVFVKVKVGDQEHEVSVKDLQRLFGQEKALTQKSMEVADQRKAVDTELQRNTAATAALLDRAKARFEPFAKIDFLLAAKDLSSEDYTNLRTAAASAYEDVQFLEQNLNGYMQAQQAKQSGDLAKQATEALKVLSGPTEKGGIEGWSEKKYDDIRGFAVAQGLDKTIVNQLVDPVAIKLIHNAMLYERGLSKVKTTKVNKTPTKVIKTTTAPASARVSDSSTKVKTALKNLRETGSTDAAADAFLARWADDADK